MTTAAAWFHAAAVAFALLARQHTRHCGAHGFLDPGVELPELPAVRTDLHDVATLHRQGQRFGESRRRTYQRMADAVRCGECRDVHRVRGGKEAFDGVPVAAALLDSAV